MYRFFLRMQRGAVSQRAHCDLFRANWGWAFTENWCLAQDHQYLSGTSATKSMAVG